MYDKCSVVPPILPHNKEYRQLCEKQRHSILDENWPCFTFLSGSLHGADSIGDDHTFFDTDPLGRNATLLAKNADLVDFTPREAGKSFTIQYNYAGISLSYSPLTKTCSFINISRWDASKGFRLYIKDHHSDDILIDSSQLPISNVVVCSTKWVRIWLGRA